ncbi:methyltransferase domain-containing protein [Fulvivirga sp. RKSG066]|uniref:methyltransferase domain-containing protein n=1 Tax=Fulvivirga aurantia TaxID=2529383 RepID=UPI0012BC5192|nr:methyltransferase domain-containing protein [Fulvivirga aurantia]MTI20421.1 methyltransferase domain-containing protein [Fulvivirga aurantia]
MSNKFSFRSEEEEIMDDLNSGGPVMDQTLKELEFINKWLGGNYVTLDGLNQLIPNHQDSTISILDIGCGGGDMLKLMAQWAKKRKLTVKLIGVDANPHVIKFAKNNTKDYPEIEYSTLNIFSEEFKKLKVDIITATLFTHHFANSDLVTLLNQFKSQVNLGIVINDLHRHWFAYHSIKILTHLFSKSPMVKNDAALSVLRAFNKKELTAILKESKLNTFNIKWLWAFRWQVVIRT